MASPRRDPLFAAAVLRLSFQRRGEAAIAGWRAVYDGVLRDLKVTDAEVERYLALHGDEVAAAIDGSSEAG